MEVTAGAGELWCLYLNVNVMSVSEQCTLLYFAYDYSWLGQTHNKPQEGRMMNPLCIQNCGAPGSSRAEAEVKDMGGALCFCFVLFLWQTMKPHFLSILILCCNMYSHIILNNINRCFAPTLDVLAK